MDFLKLKATLGLDSTEYEDGLNKAESQAGDLGNKLKSGLSVIAKAGVAAVGAATAAVGVLAKKSIEGYAEYEQLLGGVKKLYGNMGVSVEEYAKTVNKSVDEVKGEWAKLESAQNIVLKNAQNAYATAGMSANQYMEIATSFSASLINSLEGDTVKAAEQTDVAMKAISDNWNTFGGDLGMIQQAYQGFAKQNYTMLDNLKLGYGGTKTEMERLIADANEYAKANGMAADLTIDSFSDVVTAIDLIQQKQNIAGTTAREATTTIAGSLGMLKASWDNLVTGFTNPDADIGALMENVATSAGYAAKNIGPAIGRALMGIGDAVTQSLPQIIDGIPKAVDTIIIPLLNTGVKAGVALIGGIVKAIPQLASALVQTIPTLVSTITDAFGSMNLDGGGFLQGLIESIDANLPTLIDKALTLGVEFSAKLREGFGNLVSGGLEIIEHIAQGIATALPSLISNIPTIISNIAGLINDNAPKLLATGLNIIVTLGKGLIQAIPTLIANIPQILKAMWDVFTAFQWLSLGRTVITAVGNGIKAVGKNLPSILKSIGSKAWNAFKSIKWTSVGRTALQAIIRGVKTLASGVPSALKTIANAGMRAFKSINWASLGKSLVQGIISGIKSMVGAIGSAVANLVKSAFNKGKEAAKSKSPSKLFRYGLGVPIGQGVALGVEDTVPMAEQAMSGMINAMSATALPVIPFIDGLSSLSIPTTSDARTLQEDFMLQMGDQISELGDQIKEGIVDAVEGLTITLDKRAFGKATRKAVGVV